MEILASIAASSGRCGTSARNGLGVVGGHPSRFVAHSATRRVNQGCLRRLLMNCAPARTVEMADVSSVVSDFTR